MCRKNKIRTVVGNIAGSLALAFTFLIGSSLAAPLVSGAPAVRSAKENEKLFRQLGKPELSRLAALARVFEHERRMRKVSSVFFGGDDGREVPAQFAAFGFRTLILHRNQILGLWSESGPHVEIECRPQNPVVIRLVSGPYGDKQELIYQESADSAPGKQAAKTKTPGTGVVSYRDYSPLPGEDHSGQVFIINHNGLLLACMSRHQSGETVPEKAEGINGPPVRLDRTKVHQQKDVQILPLLDQKQPVQSMDFSADYQLEQGEDLWIPQDRAGHEKHQGSFGRLMDKDLKGGAYSPAEGARELFLELDTGADVRGASGSPVIQVSTGKPVGVLLSANDGEHAFYITFETISLPGAKSRPPASRTEVRAADLAGNWTEDFGTQGKTAHTLNADGSYTGSYHPAKKAGATPITFRGRWRTEGQTLIHEMTECSQPEYLKKHALTREKVIELTADSLIYQSPPGPILVKRRPPP